MYTVILGKCQWKQAVHRSELLLRGREFSTYHLSVGRKLHKEETIHSEGKINLKFMTLVLNFVAGKLLILKVNNIDY